MGNLVNWCIRIIDNSIISFWFSSLLLWPLPSKSNYLMSLFWETRPAFSELKFNFLKFTLLRGTNPDIKLTQTFFRDLYWKLANGCRLKKKHMFSLLIIIQWINSPLVGIWPFLDYMIKMIIFSDCSPKILSSEVKSCFYFKILVNAVDPWILRVPIPIIFLQSGCLLEESTDKKTFIGEFSLGWNHF